MRAHRHMLIGFSILVLGQHAAAADPDAKSAREHELLHRAQQELQQLQAENGDLQRQKNDVEAKLKAASDQLEALSSAEQAGRQHSVAVEAELHKERTAGSDLAARLEEAQRQLAAMTQKQNETASQLNQREAELADTKSSLSKSVNDNTSCQARNQKLFDYGQALLQRYRDKGVWAALTRKEPVLGLERVDEENTLQEYRDKLAAEKLRQQP
ncbi:MAG: hypothetical protein P4L83_12265 [Nevskia sp.]|nr:hypothetical protein [Nevskia sp.]